MTLNRVKLFAIAVIALPMFAVAVLKVSPVRALSNDVGVKVAVMDDIAADYKKTCAMCHKPNAEKWFEPSKMDEVLVEVVLKGKKAEKPPHMPAYEEKGVDKDKAKLLVAYMRQMRTPPSN